MKLTITKGLEPDQVKEMRGDFLSSQLLRKRIVEVLNEKIESKRNSVSRDLSNPNWVNEVAHMFGYEEGLKEVISILSEKDS